jgi:hypothetical protein
MDLKLLSYLLYLAVVVPLVVVVARTLATNGRVFLQDAFDGQAELADAVNKLLVVGFYLLNLGWAALFMANSRTIDDGQEMLEVLTTRVGVVALILGVVHMANVWVFNRVRRRAAERRIVTVPLPPAEMTTMAYPAPR